MRIAQPIRYTYSILTMLDPGIIDVSYIANFKIRCNTKSKYSRSGITQFLLNNTSACHIGDGLTIFAVKTLVLDPRDIYERGKTEEDENLSHVHNDVKHTIGNYLSIPGNFDRECGELNLGKLFIWNRWQSPGSIRGKNVFFLHRNNENVVEDLILTDLEEKPIDTHGADFRIFPLNENEILIYDDLSKIYVCSLEQLASGKLYVTYQLKFLMPMGGPTTSACKNCSMIKANYQKDENGNLKTTFLYVDWFYAKGVKLVEAECEYEVRVFPEGREIYDEEIGDIKFAKSEIIQKRQDLKEIFIMYDAPFKNLIGEGSHLTCEETDKLKYGRHYGMAPGFSFSTPLQKIGEDDDHENFLGVGHSKIRNGSHFPYKPFSKIAKAKEYIHEKLSKMFGLNYKIHYGSSTGTSCVGYIYLMYFYIVRIPKSKDLHFEMTISDSFLPIDTRELGNDNRYKFSLIFPMGLIVEKSRIVVTAGDGDYRSVILTFNKENVLKMARQHDVKRMDLHNYKYELLFVDESVSGKILTPKIRFANLYARLNCESAMKYDQRMLEREEREKRGETQSGGTDSHYYSKYRKYKNKYLQMRDLLQEGRFVGR